MVTITISDWTLPIF